MKESTAGGVAAIITAALQNFVSSTPPAVKDFGTVFLLFFIVDFLTGVVNAAYNGKLSSKSARSKFFSKSIQYLGILSLGAGGTIVTDSWSWTVTAMASTCAMEAISIIENIRGLQKSGVSLGPVAPLLDRVAKLFGDPAQSIPQPPEGSANRDRTHTTDDPS